MSRNNHHTDGHDEHDKYGVDAKIFTGQFWKLGPGVAEVAVVMVFCDYMYLTQVTACAEGRSIRLVSFFPLLRAFPDYT
jgi:hypothetical protein